MSTNWLYTMHSVNGLVEIRLAWCREYDTRISEDICTPPKLIDEYTRADTCNIIGV